MYDMTCTSCEKRVERTLNKMEGVIIAKASFSGQYVQIGYDDSLCSLKQIKEGIKAAGYSTESSKDSRFIGLVMIAAAIILLGMNTAGFDMEAKLNNASYAVLFVVGILTSIHCVGMCGGIMLSQTINKGNKGRLSSMKPGLLYNLGRVTSYTILGGAVGAVGSVFALSLPAQAGMQMFAGVFMIMMGLNMAGFSAFRKFQIKLPAAVCKIQAKPRAPFLVGILNGFMPCGPLQTMQIFALGTGSAAAGALSMFMFSLGTVPLMVTVGALSGLLSKAYTKKILKFSGVLIIMLGLIMSNRGLAIAGMNASPVAFLARIGAFGTDYASAGAIKATIKDGVQYLNMTASYSGYTPNVLYVQKDIPVKWIVDGKEISSCNKTIVIPALNIQAQLQSGNNEIAFTPGEGDLNFSCWMGMIRGQIKVVEDLEAVTASASIPAEGIPAGRPAEESEVQTKPSIYGPDITQVPTDRLVKKAALSGAAQTIEVKGIGYEIEPLIFITEVNIPVKMSLDLTAFDNPQGKFTIIDTSNMQIIHEFQGTNGIVDTEFTMNKAGTYGIYLGENLLGVIEPLENFDSVPEEEIRSKYLR